MPRDAISIDIRRAWKRLALEWHPDRNQHRADEVLQTIHSITPTGQRLNVSLLQAGVMVRAINEAFSVLSVPIDRARYDRFVWQRLLYLAN